MRILVLISALLILAAGCKRKEGCLDRLATNYDAKAKKAGTCFYEGGIVMWKDTRNPNNYANEVLEYYFDGELLLTDSLLLENFSEPVCGDSRAKNFKIDLGAATSKLIHYKIILKNNKQPIADSIVEVLGGYCIPHRLNL